MHGRAWRAFLWVGAAGFLAWEGLGALLWVREAGGLGSAVATFWARLRGDWMLLVVVTDHITIAFLALLWTWRDAGRRGWPLAQRAGWSVAFVALGSPALLSYLAGRASNARGEA